MRYFYTFAIFLALVLPAGVAYAEVVVSEIAWMGTSESSADEWIELENTGDTAVDLTGWSLRAEDGSPTLTLSGSIVGGGYYMIERTDDESVPGVAADLVATFGNGLGNAGETLVLRDASDAIIDRVVSGENWTLLGGDNTTKATAQRVDSKWVTGAPTPKAKNVSAGEVLGASTASGATSTGVTANPAPASGSGSVASRYPRTFIVAEAGSDVRTFTGFPLTFHGSSTGLYNESLPFATYRWNFGDGSAGEGREVTHAYQIPGDYLVTLEVFWGNYRERDRLSVSVADPDVEIAEAHFGGQGYIELKNRATREIDISGWAIESTYAPRFVFPPNTIILSGRSLLLPSSISKVAATSTLALYRPSGEVGSAWQPPTPKEGASVVMPSMKTTVAPKSVTMSGAGEKNERQGAPKESVAVLASSTEETLWEGGAKSQVASVGAGGQYSNTLLFVSGILLVILAFLYYRTKRQPSIEEEYAIIEDIIEGKEEGETSR